MTSVRLHKNRIFWLCFCFCIKTAIFGSVLISTKHLRDCEVTNLSYRAGQTDNLTCLPVSNGNPTSQCTVGYACVSNQKCNNGTAETEFLVFKILCRFSSAFRKLKADIFIGFRTPYCLS